MSVSLNAQELQVYNNIIDENKDHVGELKLGKKEQVDIGIRLSKSPRFWESLLNSTLFRGVAKRHLRGKTATLLTKANINFVGIEKRSELKFFKKQKLIPKDMLLTNKNGQVEQHVLRAHHAFEFVRACKKDDHWIHGALGMKATGLAATDLGHVSKDFSEFKDVMPYLDNWDELGQLANTTQNSADFGHLCNKASADGQPNLSTLRDYVATYAQITEGPGRAQAAVDLSTQHSEVKAFLPDSMISLSSPITVDDTALRIGDLRDASKAHQKTIADHEYHLGGQIDAFSDYVKANMQADNLAAATQEIPRLAKAFNSEDYGRFMTKLESDFPDFAEPIRSALEAIPGVAGGDLNYTRAGGFESLPPSLAAISSARENFSNNKLDDVFSQLFIQHLQGKSWDSLGEISVGLKTVAEELSKVDHALQDLSQLRSICEQEGLGEMFSDLLKVQVRQLGSNINQNSLEHLTQTIKSAVNLTLVDRYARDVEDKFGAAIGTEAKAILLSDPAIAAGTTTFRDTPAHKNVQSNLKLLDALKKGIAEEFTEEEFNAVLNTASNLRRAENQPALLLSLDDSKTIQGLSQTFALALMDLRVKEYSRQFGLALHPFVKTYLRDKEPAVFNGETRYDQGTFFQATSINEQLSLILPYVTEKYDNVNPETIKYLLMSPDLGSLTIDERLNEIQTIHQWTGFLAPDKQSPNRELAQSFSRELGVKYLTRPPTSVDFAKDVKKIFSYATSLTSKGPYSPSVVASGIKGLLENQGDNSEEAIRYASGLPSTVSTIIIEQKEKQLFGQCVRAQVKASVLKHCQQDGHVVDARDEGLATLLSAKFTDIDRLPKKADFTLKYIDSLAKASVDILHSTSLTPSQVVSYLEQASRQHVEALSFNLKTIDEDFSKTPKNVQDALAVVLQGVVSRANEVSKVTYGSILKTARENTGAAAIAFLKTTVENLLPPESKGEVKRLDRALNELEKAWQRSEYSSLDKILDALPEQQQDVSRMAKNGLDMATVFLNNMRVDEGFDPATKEMISTMLKTHFDAEIASLDKLPDSANLGDIMDNKTSPIASVLIPELLLQIDVARSYREAIAKGELKEVPEDAGALPKLLLEVFPKVRGFLKNEFALGIILKGATSKPGRFLIPRLAKPIIKLFGKNALTKEQQDLVIATIPAALNIVHLLDLTSDGNRERLGKYIKIMDVMVDAANNDERPVPKEFAKEMMTAVGDLLEDWTMYGDAGFAGLKAIGQVQANT
ncbi:MAG: hypothetical protein Q8K75_10770 [Chlamydiales bacterium]|nr:hypothetical protein [Chlamydiales bacterium]